METIIQNFNNAIGWSILHSLWQGACIYLILIGILITFPKISASNKYRIAFLTQISLFLSFVYTLYLYSSFDPINTAGINLNEQQELILYVNYLKSKSWSITQMFPYLVSFYSIGVFIQVLLSLKSIQTLKWIKEKSSYYIPFTWQYSFDKIVQLNKGNANISLKVSDAITVPITIGFLKPLIIIPAAYINNISEEEAEAILLHEFAHIKRQDYFFNIVLIIMETLLFFNPFVWLISKHLKTERELACDDFASQRSKTPHTYASALLKVEILRKEAVSAFAMAATGPHKYKLLDRIKRINDKNMETKYTSIKHQVTAILLVSISVIFVAWINPEYAKKSKKEKSHIYSPVNQNIIIKERVDIGKYDTIKYHKSTGNIKNSTIPTDTITILNKTLENEELQNLAKKIEAGGKDLENYFSSPEWQKNIKDIEKNSAEIQKYFDSPAWKEKIAKVEENSKKLEEYFNSNEWKEKIAKVEENSKKLDEFFNSNEWKEKIADVEENSKKLDEYFNSNEWKDKIAKIDSDTKAITEKFNSSEWKEKARQLTELYNSNEYKSIQEKYEKDLESLKQNKNIK